MGKRGIEGMALYVLSAVLVIVAVALVVVGCGGGTSKERISVTASGVGNAQPDEARVTVAVVTEAATVQQATAQADQVAQGVIGALKGLGLDEKSIKTETVEIYPNYSEPGSEGGTSEISGYTATNRIAVTTKKVDTVNQIIQTAIAAGANSVDTLEMVASEEEVAEAIGLEKAVKNARKKAEVAAKACGRKLGKVISVTDITQAPYYEEGGYTGGAGNVETAIAPGQNEYRVEARVVFELE
jgi:uncharacterized protein YggE